MHELHAERCQYTSNILKDLIAKCDEEALHVIGESAEEGIVGMYNEYAHAYSTTCCISSSAILYSSTRVHSLTMVLAVHNYCNIYLIAGHNLSKLADYDLLQIPDVKTLGHDMICKVQRVMDVQFSHQDSGTMLPKDKIQAIIIGVSTMTPINFPLF